MRLAVFATHPIQYQAPLWRELARSPGLDVVVYYFSDQSVRGGMDPEFAIPVKWDVELLDGYEHVFIMRDANLERPSSVRMPQPYRLLGEGRFDWVMLQGYMHCFERQVARAAKRLGIRVLIRGEFSDVKQGSLVKTFLRRAYLKWFYSHVDSFCFIGEEARLHLSSFGIGGDRLYFSPYSVDTKLFETQNNVYDRVQSRSILGLGESTFVFLLSGKLIPRKEPLLFLDAVSQLPNLNEVAVVMLGDGPIRDKVVRRGKHVLGSRFLFQGFVNQSELGKYFKAADAFVLPSSVESWGLVVNEAMQFGLPVVVSSGVGCRRDLIVEGETGFTFRRGNVIALAETLSKLMSDSLKARSMGIKARKLISRYSTEASAKGLLAAIGYDE